MQGGRYLALALALALAACAEEEGPAGRGRQVYLAQCTACHNSDPAKDGPLGPAVKGSSRELLEARLLHGSYPPGYTPKWNTAAMQPQPALAPTIPDLAAFLAPGR
jgi:mono/diheme cytochrome c family protein